MRSSGSGAVQICTKASMQQSLLKEEGLTSLSFAVRTGRHCFFYCVSIQMADLPLKLTVKKEISLVYPHFINL